MREINKIIIHHSASKQISVSKYVDILYNQHVVINGWNHIGYHYIIDAFGSVKNTCPVSFFGAHCFGQNKDSIGVCFVGNYNRDVVTNSMMAAFRRLQIELELLFGELALQPHCSYRNTLCPGKYILEYFDSKFAPLHTPSEWLYLKDYKHV